MTFYAKTVWTVSAALLAGLSFWLGTVMPAQGWAQWDGRRWQVVAEGWAVLWRGWPLVLTGIALGCGVASLVLARVLKLAKEADFEARIARLTQERDEAMTAAEARVAAREQAAQQQKLEASAKQREADIALRDARAAREQVEQERSQADRDVKAAQYRATNAICAAERIKRRAAKQRSDSPTSAPRQTV